VKFKDQIELWLNNGKLKEESPHKDQIKILIEKAQKDIKTANINLLIDLENSYTLAYNSMLRTGRALVLSKGYRTSDGAQHKTAVEFCRYLIDDGGLIDAFDHMRRTRNTLIYDPFNFSDFEKTDVEHAIESAHLFLKAAMSIIE
jgi:uncharacterized protein (UPF0332 family)